MTPNQREDLDREMQHEARDYEEWKPCNRRQKDDWSDRAVWILWTTIWLLVGVLAVFALNWLEAFGRHI
jgi:hypothetical protein